MLEMGYADEVIDDHPMPAGSLIMPGFIYKSYFLTQGYT